jgi:hypothetical protein
MQSLAWIAAIVLVFGPLPSASTARSPDHHRRDRITRPRLAGLLHL